MADRDDIRAPKAYEVFRLFADASLGRRAQSLQSILDDDVQLSSLRLVVDLRFNGGTEIRAATRAIEYSSSRLSRSFAAQPYLVSEPDVIQGFTLGQADPEVRKMRFSLVGAIEALDPAAFMARGEMLAGVAEVFFINDGGEYDERRVVLRGDIDDVTFGAINQQIDIVVMDPSTTLDVEVPVWTLDTDRWPDIGEESIGERVPIVLNGGIVPCPRVDISTTGTDDRFLVGVGHDIGINDAAVNAANATPAASPVKDGLGLLVQTITFASGANDENDSVHADITCGERYSVVQAVRELLFRYSGLGSLGINEQMFGIAEARFPESLALPQVVINSPVRILEYISGTFLADYPSVSLMYDGGGLGAVVADYRSPPVARYTVGVPPLLDRETLVSEIPKRNMFNRFTVRYDYKPARDAWFGISTRTPTNSALCAMLESRIGLRDFGEIELLTVHDSTMAEYVIDWLVEHFARPSYTVEYKGVASIYMRIRVGDTIALTDPEFGWDEEPAIVERLGYRRGDSILGLRVYPKLWNRLSGASEIVAPPAQRDDI